MQRQTFINKLSEVPVWDLIVIGGGATGLGIAVDAASRGYSTLLLEQYDFAKGTSSRSTKLVHGGVRYLAQGNIKLVYDALHERGVLLKNAPHLVKRQAFIIPCYSAIEKLKYLTGLKIYDALSGRLSLGRSRFLNRGEVIRRLPNISASGLTGGVEYFDGQFDDARLAINLAETSAEHGGVLLNYFKVNDLLKEKGAVCGVSAIDLNTHIEYSLKAKAVINATGVFVDDILQLDDPGQRPMIRPSQGVHLVLNSSFLDSDSALMIPRTPDGRVMFAVPWHDYVLLGTTDTPLEKNSVEPVALEKEIDFILDTAKGYLARPPGREDVLSVFAGLRPLAAPQKDRGNTKEISRDHKLFVSDSALITITGGKWTTYRKMAEETVDRAIETGKLSFVKCNTKNISIHGSKKSPADGLSVYGSDEEAIHQLIQQQPSLGNRLSVQFPYTEAHVVWAVRHEMALTVEDVLARRLRILFLDARAAIVLAPRVAGLMAKELNRDGQWVQEQVKEFSQLARNYLLSSDAHYLTTQ